MENEMSVVRDTYEGQHKLSFEGMSERK